MTEGLASFHDTDNGCVNLVLSILEHSLCCVNILLLRLFELYLINFDSAKFVLELAVEEERIAIIDITALGFLD